MGQHRRLAVEPNRKVLLHRKGLVLRHRDLVAARHKGQLGGHRDLAVALHMVLAAARHKGQLGGHKDETGTLVVGHRKDLAADQYYEGKMVPEECRMSLIV